MPTPAPAIGGIAKPVSEKRVQELEDLNPPRPPGPVACPRQIKFPIKTRENAKEGWGVGVSSLVVNHLPAGRSLHRDKPSCFAAEQRRCFAE